RAIELAQLAGHHVNRGLLGLAYPGDQLLGHVLAGIGPMPAVGFVDRVGMKRRVDHRRVAAVHPPAEPHDRLPDRLLVQQLLDLTITISRHVLRPDHLLFSICMKWMSTPRLTFAMGIASPPMARLDVTKTL